MSEFDRIVLSGASGAIGAVIARDLMRHYPAAQVICVLRNEQSLQRLTQILGPAQSARIVPIFADLASEISLERLTSPLGRARRCLAVHCAADVSWTKADRIMAPINVHGTARFAEIAMSMSREPPALVFLSTAFIAEDGPFRNVYEETKFKAERLLVERYGSRMHIAVVRCSLVVGSSADGAISRFNGLYPLIRLVALAEVPCLIADANYRLDTVPVDYVSREVMQCAELMATGREFIKVVAATGDHDALLLSELVERVLVNTREHRSKIGLGPPPPISVISNRQFQFLLKAAASWDMRDRFNQVERISAVMAGYVTHGETGRAITPVWLGSPAPPPHAYMDRIIRYWLDQHSDRVNSDRARLWQTGSRA